MNHNQGEKSTPAIRPRRNTAIVILWLALSAAIFAEIQPSDELIHDQVLLKLVKDPIVKGGGIEVDVSHGVVTLKGWVGHDKQKEKAVRLD